MVRGGGACCVGCHRVDLTRVTVSRAFDSYLSQLPTSDRSADTPDMNDDRQRLPDGTIVNEDGSLIAPMDPDLVARMEAAKDAKGCIHDPALANEYFEALQKQSEDTRRINGWPEPVIEQGSVVPSAGEGEGPLSYVEGEPEVPFVPADDADDDSPGGPVTVVIN